MQNLKIEIENGISGIFSLQISRGGPKSLRSKKVWKIGILFLKDKSIEERT